MAISRKINKQFVGVYLIDGNSEGTQLATTTKPNWFRRLITNYILGWKWISIKELKSIENNLDLKIK